MSPKQRSVAVKLYESLGRVRTEILRLDRDVRHAKEEFSGFSQLREVLEEFASSSRRVEKCIESACKNEHRVHAEEAMSFSDEEVLRFRALNHHLAEITDFLRDDAREIDSRMGDNKRSPDDPMVDYEIEAEICYTLRQDDPEYDEEEGDNYLTMRHESIKRLVPDDDRMFKEYRDHEPWIPATLENESFCWLLHDLIDHSYGPEKPCLPLRDCLRIGSIHVDVEVRQQYNFYLTSGKWEKRWTC